MLLTTATVRVPVAEGEIASFTDPDPFTDPYKFTASINWGDGTQTSGNVGWSFPYSAGNFTVGPPSTGNPSGHTYQSAGSYTVSVSLTNGTTSSTATGTVNVTASGSPPPPPSGNPPPPPSGNPQPPQPVTPSSNYQGLWWVPGGAESGWGINFAHQGDIIFASWFTYDLAGKGLWLTMVAPQSALGVYSGPLYTTTGPAFNAVPFNPFQVKEILVGTGRLTFSDTNDGTFAYTVNGIAQTKNITREVFGPLPVCTTATANLAEATNYTDLWWASPAGSEPGWGINLTQEGDTIFTTWFTYDLDGSQMWLSATAANTRPRVYAGTLYRSTGPAFDAVPFNPADVALTAVGTATFTFSDGNNATFAYTVNGIAQNKAITREVFQDPGTVCQ